MKRRSSRTVGKAQHETSVKKHRRAKDAADSPKPGRSLAPVPVPCDDAAAPAAAATSVLARAAAVDPAGASVKENRVDEDMHHDEVAPLQLLSPEMMRAILLYLDRWSDIVACLCAAVCFHGVLAPSDVWPIKYAPETGWRLTRSQEPVEAYKAVYRRWGVSVEDFDFEGMRHLAKAGMLPQLVWLDERVDSIVAHRATLLSMDLSLVETDVPWPLMERCRAAFRARRQRHRTDGISSPEAPMSPVPSMMAADSDDAGQTATGNETLASAVPSTVWDGNIGRTVKRRVCIPLHPSRLSIRLDRILDEKVSDNGDPRAAAERGKVAREAASHGRADIVLYLLATHRNDPFRLVWEVMSAAIAAGHIAVLEAVHTYARSLGASDGGGGGGMDDGGAHRWCPAHTVHADGHGSAASAHVLDYLEGVACPLALKVGSDAFDNAVSGGKVVMAQWIASRCDFDGYSLWPRSTRDDNEAIVCVRSTVDLASRNGHFDVVRWLHESGIKRCAMTTLLAAVESSRPGADVCAFLAWATTPVPVVTPPSSTPFGDDPSTPDSAGRPHADTMPEEKKARFGQRCPVPEWRDARLGIRAAEVGNIAVARWLCETHPDAVTSEIARHAATHLHIDIVVYLNDIGMVGLDECRALRRAVSNVDSACGTYDLARFAPKVADAVRTLAKAGASFDPAALFYAMRAQCFEVIEALVLCYARSGSIDPRAVMVDAAKIGHLNVPRWVRDNVHGACLCVAVKVMTSRWEKTHAHPGTRPLSVLGLPRTHDHAKARPRSTETPHDETREIKHDLSYHQRG